MADGGDFGRDLEGDGQDLECSIRLQFREELLGCVLRQHPPFRHQDGQFNEAECAHGNRALVMYFRPENPELLLRQLSWIISPVQDDMRIG